MKFIGFLVILALIAGGIYLSGTEVNVDGGDMPEVDVNVTGDSGNLPEYEVKQTEEGRMPSVDVDTDVKGGALPDVDVDTPEIDVETETKTIEVPTGIDVDAAKGSAIDDATKPEYKEVD